MVSPPDPRRTPDSDGDPDELVGFLERDQLTADTAVPVARAHWGARVQMALWALRIFVLVVSAMVIYTFAVSIK